MDDFLRNFLLAICGVGALVLLVVTYLWYFVFGRSLRAVLMAGLSILMNRDSTIDINADVELTKRPEDVKNEMTQEVEALNFHGEVAEQGKFVPNAQLDEGFGAQAVDIGSDKHELVSSSFASSRFRRVARRVMRPFLRDRISAQDDVNAKNVPFSQDINDSQ